MVYVCRRFFQHDVAYWKGGTEQQQDRTDIELKQCVSQKTGDEDVRVGGSPYFYNRYPWGYGWSNLRNHRGKYQALTEDELQQIKKAYPTIFTNNNVIIVMSIKAIEIHVSINSLLLRKYL